MLRCDLGRARALLFDLDGTIVDTETAFRDSWLQAGYEYGLQASALDVDKVAAKQLDGLSTAEALFGIHEESLLVAIAGFAHDYRQKARTTLELLPGVEDFVLRARRSSVRTALVTNAPAWRVQEVFAGVKLTTGLDLATLFDVVVHSHHRARPKPAPDLYEEAVRLLDVPPAVALAFEDSVTGLAAATSAGVRCVHILQGCGRSRCIRYATACFPNFMTAAAHTEEGSM
ncbi:HAD family hydrolase [Curtobacterium sp. RRHDQ66]|uniref:HAD family hydrolase n=1 Tax=Curtobacterium guangdongense TaxID=3413380 RepID=UPI003BF39F0E